MHPSGVLVCCRFDNCGPNSSIKINQSTLQLKPHGRRSFRYIDIIIRGHHYPAELPTSRRTDTEWRMLRSAVNVGTMVYHMIRLRRCFRICAGAAKYFRRPKNRPRWIFARNKFAATPAQLRILATVVGNSRSKTSALPTRNNFAR